MIKCKLCKKITEKREATGKFTTYKKLEPKGREIIREVTVCMNCNGEKLI